MADDTRKVYLQGVEGVFTIGHRNKLTPVVKAAIREAGIDLDQKLKPFYSPAVTNEATRQLRNHVYGHEPNDDKAYFMIGVATADGFLETTLGKTLVGVFKLLGFRRVINRMPQVVAAGANYQTVELVEIAPNIVDMKVSHTEPHPSMFHGTLQRAFAHYFQAPDFKVEILKRHPPGATYRLAWKK